ncbi:MAG: hypothetical protein ACOYT8_05210 [Candidatus Dependentiae bacterium]
MQIKKFSLITLLFFFNVCFSNEPNQFDKCQTYLAHSKILIPIKKFMHVVHTIIKKPLGLSDSIASEEYQQLANEVKQSLNGPLLTLPPVKTTYTSNFRKKFFNYETVALTNSEGIFVNETALQYSPFYGFKRFIMHHEAIHYKYDDSISMLLCWFSGYYASRFTISKIFAQNKRTKFFSSIAEILTAIAVSKKYHRYAEHRADIEGAHATQCYHCLKEYVTASTDHSEYGYASHSELKSIAKKLKQTNSLCMHHLQKI